MSGGLGAGGAAAGGAGGDDGAVVTLTDDVVATLGVSTTIDVGSATDAFEFHRTEEYAVSSCAGAQIRLFNMSRGRVSKTVSSRKYGTCNVIATHHHASVLYAATESAHKGTILYHSLHDNKVLRYFKGHAADVCSMVMSPTSDVFVSVDVDGVVNVWDISNSSARPLASADLACKGRAVLATDPAGMLFIAVATNGIISAFGIDDYESGPFASEAIKSLVNKTTDWAAARFSPDGNFVALASPGAGFFIVGSQYFNVLLHEDLGGARGAHSVTWSPDSQYVVVGAGNGSAQVWSVAHADEEFSKATLVRTLGGHSGPVSAVAWHPSRALLATSGASQTALWLPAA